MPEPTLLAIHVKCLKCGIEYDVEPSVAIGGHAWYSSSVDNCKNCDTFDIETSSFLHPEDLEFDAILRE